MPRSLKKAPHAQVLTSRQIASSARQRSKKPTSVELAEIRRDGQKANIMPPVASASAPLSRRKAAKLARHQALCRKWVERLAGKPPQLLTTRVLDAMASDVIRLVLFFGEADCWPVCENPADADLNAEFSELFKGINAKYQKTAEGEITISRPHKGDKSNAWIWKRDEGASLATSLGAYNDWS